MKVITLKEWLQDFFLELDLQPLSQSLYHMLLILDLNMVEVLENSYKNDLLNIKIK
ncbi:hypothetical protein [Catenibacterium mitsuokai]|uniref:hypothetical protein n=1 Tax=Catenibacterium mitsuokai TaxID=100886 RepID=UPI00319E7520